MKRLVSLVLALVMMLSLMSFAAAEDVKEVTIRILGHFNERNHADDRSDCPDYMLEFYDKIRNLVPGYKIEIEWMLYEDSEAQIPLLLASNDIPDIFISNGTSFMEYLDTGFFLYDLNPYLEEYGQDILKNIEERSREICTVGDGLPAIPAENFYYKFRTIIRTDWVEKLGFEVKKVYTLSELEEILIAMATQDPDGNGENDTFGLGTRYNGRDWTQSFMPIFGAFNGQPDDYYINEETNEVYAYNYSEDFRNALIWLNKLWEAKAIDNEIFVLNYDQAKIKAAKGSAGMFSGWWNVMGNLLDAGLLQIQPEARLDFIYVTSDDGKYEGTMDNGTIWKTAMISAECEAPEAAIAIINYMHTPEGQGAGNAEILDENGQFTYEEGTEPSDYTRLYESINWNKVANSTDLDAHYNAGWRAIPFANLFNNMALRRASNNRLMVYTMPEGEDDPAVYNTDEWKSNYRNYLNYIGNMMHNNPDGMGVYTSVFYGLPATQEQIELAAGIETHRTEWIVSFVTGEKDVEDDAQWNEYLKTAEGKGAKKVMDSLLKVYNELQGTNLTAAKIAK